MNNTDSEPGAQRLTLEQLQKWEALKFGTSTSSPFHENSYGGVIGLRPERLDEYKHCKT